MKKKTGFMMVVLVLATVLMSGCTSSEDAPVSDRETLQGTWVGTEIGQEGEARMIFSGDTIDFKGAHPQEWYKGTAVLHETSTPKQADFTISECPMPNYVGKLSKAIYTLEGNIFTIAGSEPGDENRPNSFDPSGATRVFKLTLQP